MKTLKEKLLSVKNSLKKFVKGYVEKYNSFFNKKDKSNLNKHLTKEQGEVKFKNLHKNRGITHKRESIIKTNSNSLTRKGTIKR